MAYKALYRIYRPQNFNEVVGQKHILQTIRNAIKENKIAHAYLFSGPRGTGKTSMAKLLAKALNCEDEDVLSKPCNECENCQAINEGPHPDVLETVKRYVTFASKELTGLEGSWKEFFMQMIS